MKTGTLYRLKCGGRIALSAAICLLLLTRSSKSQTPRDATGAANYGSSFACTHSPSITSAIGKNLVYSAFVVETTTGGGSRTVHVSKSTNNGVDWTDEGALSMPSDNGIDNMDDPQLLTNTGESTGKVLNLVVHAYEKGSSKSQSANGSTWPTLFANSGIYFIRSTDGGQHWGSWATVAHENTSSSSSNFVTLDHPRIAFRRDYANLVNDVPGTIVWERRQFTLSSSDNTIPYSSIQTAVGLRFFSDAYTMLPGLLPNYGSYTSYITTSSDGQAQRPNVAISPDGGIWLSYFVVSSQNWLAASNAGYYVQKGSVSIIKDNGTLKASPYFLSGDISKITGTTGAILPGHYDPTRGYFYTEEGAPNAINQYDSYDIELAQGPSIQVAMSAVPASANGQNPEVPAVTQCEPTYSVGVVYTDQEAYNSAYSDASSDRNRWLTFWQADVPWNKRPQDVTWNYFGWRSNTMPDYHTNSIYQSNTNTYMDIWEQFLFPVLKYSTYIPERHKLPAQDWYASHFVLSYLYASVCQGTAGNHFHQVTCRTGFSFNDRSFEQFADAEQRCGSDNYADGVDASQWGTKLDACGEQGQFQVHSIWHNASFWNSQIATWECDPGLLTNAGGAIIAQRYLDAFPYNDLTAYLTDGASGIFDVTVDGNLTSSGDPYNYFNYNNLHQPTNITIHNSTTPYSPSSSLENVSLGSFLFGSFIPPLPTAGNIGYGLYWAHYTGTTGIPMSWFSKSDQRNIVMTGDIAHAVYQDNNHIYYSFGLPDPVAIGSVATKRIWSQSVQLDASTDNAATSPSIAVYQENRPIVVPTAGVQSGNTNNFNTTNVDYTALDGVDGFDGKSAIAVTWTEWSNAQAVIKMRTREFDVCSGTWNKWSNIITVFTSPFPRPSNAFNGMPTTAVSPLVAPKDKPFTTINGKAVHSTTPDVFEKTYLLGWVTTWNDRDALYPHGNTWEQSSSYRRPNLTNGSWGTYGTSILGPFNLFQRLNFSKSMDDDIWYTSSTNGENKHFQAFNYLLNPKDQSNYRIDYALSMDGYGTQRIYSQSVNYDIVNNATIGQYQPPAPPNQITLIPHGAAHGKYRNPCVTVNSSGQTFMAWEAMYAMGPHVGKFQSRIEEANTFYDPKGGSPWLKSGHANWLNVIVQDAQDFNFRWLLDPSISGCPKTLLNESVGAGSDDDYAQVGMLYHQAYDGTGAYQYKLIPWSYSEAPYSPGVPDPGALNAGWNPIISAYLQPQSGELSQVSFSTYPQYYTPFYMGGNFGAAPFASLPVSIGSFKLGAFDSLNPYELYRSETRIQNDSAEAMFVWGGVHVNTADSVSSQIRLYAGAPDSNGFASHDALRDSIFRTQPFELPVGSTISYFRGEFYPGFDSINSLVLENPALSANYTLELVHASGIIDTLEQVEFAPGLGKFITPALVHSAPNFLGTDTVILRVRGQVNGFSDDDSLCYFACETYLGSYQPDTNVFVGFKRSTSLSFDANANSLQVMGPYPNPVTSNKTSILLSCPKHLDATLVVTDLLGRPVSEVINYQGTGEWQNIRIPTPNVPGCYLVRISAGSDEKVIPITVLR